MAVFPTGGWWKDVVGPHLTPGSALASVVGTVLLVHLLALWFLSGSDVALQSCVSHISWTTKISSGEVRLVSMNVLNPLNYFIVFVWSLPGESKKIKGHVRLTIFFRWSCVMIFFAVCRIYLILLPKPSFKDSETQCHWKNLFWWDCLACAVAPFTGLCTPRLACRWISYSLGSSKRSRPFSFSRMGILSFYSLFTTPLEKGSTN